MSVKPIDINPNDLACVKSILNAHLPADAPMDIKVWVFGSRATWTTKDSSDLDLAIDAGRPLTREEEFALADAFDESDLAYKVDIVDMQTVSESFKAIIERDMVELEWGDKWEEKKLSEFCTFQYGKGLPARDRKFGLIPVISSAGVIGNHCESLVKTAGIIIGRKGTVGSVTFSPNPFWPIDTAFYIEDKPKIRDIRFTYYLLKTLKLETMNSDSAVPGLNRENVHSLSILIPKLNEQKKISNILSALDDRITLLRETNATLESIAQTLFKSWFINFDPVHAKQQGRLPDGMDAQTAALFPDSFETSELGEIPKGWNSSILGEQTSYMSRGISPKYCDIGGVAVINQKCIRNYIVDLNKARKHNPDQRKIDGRELQLGDVLVNSTGVGTLGRVAQILSLEETTIVDSHITVVRAKSPLTWNFIGLSLMNIQHQIEEMGEGTTGQTELSRGKLAQIKVIVPSPPVLKEFDNIVIPLRNKFSFNNNQAQTLEKLRDAMLPRLISGQLRIKNDDYASVIQGEF